MNLQNNELHKKLIMVNLQEGRAVGQNSWDLPCFGHPLSMGVFPLFAEASSQSDPHLIPVGSSFCISNLGILATAEHNIRESMKFHWNGVKLRQHSQLPESYELKDMGLSIFHHFKKGENLFSANVWPLESLHGAQPTDVIYGFPKFQSEFPFLNLTVSFAVPPIGSKITCVGYTDSSFPKDGISINALKTGQLDWKNVYSHKFRAVEGRVTRIFTQRFANGFISGPCITIDEEVFHGMSGGPAFNEQGHICGIVSAGATEFFNAPASIVSLLYPTLLTKIKFGVSMGPVRIEANRTVLELVAQNSIRTDDGEKLLAIKQDEDGVKTICPMIRKEDSTYVYNDFNGFQKSEQASKEPF